MYELKYFYIVTKIFDIQTKILVYTDYNCSDEDIPLDLVFISPFEELRWRA
jgi:hypothetical protein